MFSPEKASATVHIPASTQHTNGLFEDYSNVCLCSPIPPSPPHLPLVLTYTPARMRKQAQKTVRGKKQTYIFRKQWESNTTLSCTQIQNGLSRGWPTIDRNNSVLATSIVNPNINNRAAQSINAWRHILYMNVRCKSPICLPIKCNMLLKDSANSSSLCN